MQISVLGPVEVTADRPFGGHRQGQAAGAAGGAGPRRGLDGVERAARRGALGRGAAAHGGQDGAALRLAGSQGAGGHGDGAEIVTRGRGIRAASPRRTATSSAARRRALGGPSDRCRREALALWRGSPLADVAEEPFAAGEIRRLEELRADRGRAGDRRRPGGGPPSRGRRELEVLVARTRCARGCTAQRMLALYRWGRQAEALRPTGGAIGAGRADRRRARPGAARAARRDPAPGPAARARGARRRAAAGSSSAARRRSWAVTAELRALRARGDDAHARRRALIAVLGPAAWARRGWPRSWRARCTGTARRCCTPRAPARRRQALAAIARARAPASVRRCSSSTTSTARRPRCARRCASCSRGRDALPRPGPRHGAGPRRRWRRRVDATIVLGPLDAEAWAPIARLYAPARGRDGAGRRHPGRERRRARAACTRPRVEWARRAGRATRGRRGRARGAAAPAARARRRSSRASVEACRRHASGPERRRRRTASPVVCPFKGLAAFDAEDAAYFFGRERLVAEMVARLVGAPLLGVVGPSGSGKSSVRARRAAAGAGARRAAGQRRLDAGADPAGRAAAARAARRHGRTGRGGRAGDRRRPVRGDVHGLPRRAASATRSSTRSRAARDPRRARWSCSRVRADFYGRCAAYPALARLLGANQRARRADAPRRAAPRDRAAGRTRRTGASTPDLDDALIADVDGRARGAAAALDGAARAVAAPATGAGCGLRRTSAPAASAVRGAAGRGRVRAVDARGAGGAREAAPASRRRGRAAAPSSAGGCRWRSSSADGDRSTAPSSRC